MRTRLTESARKADVARGLAAKRSERTSCGIPMYYEDLGALKAAADEFAAQHSFSWHQHDYCSKEQQEKKYRDTSRRHRAKCGRLDEGLTCKVCARGDQGFYVELYQVAYEGKDAEGTIVARLFVIAECVCSQKQTHCLGCVLRIRGLEFPAAPSSGKRKRRLKFVEYATEPDASEDHAIHGAYRQSVHARAFPGAVRQLAYRYAEPVVPSLPPNKSPSGEVDHARAASRAFVSAPSPLTVVGDYFVVHAKGNHDTKFTFGAMGGKSSGKRLAKRARTRTFQNAPRKLDFARSGSTTNDVVQSPIHGPVTVFGNVFRLITEESHDSSFTFGNNVSNEQIQ